MSKLISHLSFEELATEVIACVARIPLAEVELVQVILNRILSC